MSAQTTAKEAYLVELAGVRRRLSELRDRYDAAIGEGTFSGAINWAHVGDLGHINELLDDVLAFGGLRRIP